MIWTKAAALCLSLLAQLPQPSAVPTPAQPPGYGPWRLGMSQEEVKGVTEFGPYSVVSSTGGLETRNGQFTGGKTTISFVFGEHGLRIIQIWAYEGRDLEQAVEAFYRVYHHLEVSLGSVEIPGLKMAEHAELDTFKATLQPRLAAVPKNRAYKVQIAPVARLSQINVFLISDSPASARLLLCLSLLPEPVMRQPPNTSLQRTRSSALPPRSPLSSKPLGGREVQLG